MGWAVHKFGGTSVADAASLAQVAEIVSSQMVGDTRLAVVVSAMGGKPKVTDQLLRSVALAAVGGNYEAVLEEVRCKHTAAIGELGLSWSRAEEVVTSLDSDLVALRHLLRAVSLMRYEDEKMKELVSGYGETWSAKLLCSLLNARVSVGATDQFLYVNARDVLIIDEAPETGPEVMWSRTGQLMNELLAQHDPGVHLILTGFIATTSNGVATTLKRDGSDYSASIFGRLLSASGISIWTDVDGVMSADPRAVPEARVLAEVSYNEAMELAYFGAKVIHPKTMQPAVMGGIPIYIRNTFNPDFPGTRVWRSSTHTTDREHCVCGFSTVEDIVLLNIEGSGMIGVPGVAQRLFGALHRMGISVILISQASSEHSISVAIQIDKGKAAKEGIEEAFFSELRHGLISSVDLTSRCGIVAAVGDGMSHIRGTAGKFFHALGKASINVLAVAQGCSERNISCVVAGEDVSRALRAVHAAFLPTDCSLSLGVVDCTGSGAELLDLLSVESIGLMERFGLGLAVTAITDMEHMVLSKSPAGVDLKQWRQLIASEGSKPVDLAALVDHVNQSSSPFMAMVDCSGAQSVGELHSDWLERGLHVVSCNASAMGSGLDLYTRLLRTRRKCKSSYQYEATVGGGLPVLLTLQSLLSAGDEVTAVSGVLSPLLSYIMNRLSPRVAVEGSPQVGLAQACKEAVEKGLVRGLKQLSEEMAGVRLRSQLLVIGRELGLKLRQEDVVVEALIQSSGDEVSEVSEVREDDALIQRLEAAHERGNVLRYAFKVDQSLGTASAGLLEVPRSHVLGQLEGVSLCACYQTKRMGETPLILQGGGGSHSAKANAVCADIIRVARDLGCARPGHLMELDGEGEVTG
ncbi:unnamed protein product [Chrysoparadoxa australica]